MKKLSTYTKMVSNEKNDKIVKWDRISCYEKDERSNWDIFENASWRYKNGGKKLAKQYKLVFCKSCFCKWNNNIFVRIIFIWNKLNSKLLLHNLNVCENPRNWASKQVKLASFFYFLLAGSTCLVAHNRRKNINQALIAFMVASPLAFLLLRFSSLFSTGAPRFEFRLLYAASF